MPLARKQKKEEDHGTHKRPNTIIPLHQARKGKVPFKKSGN